MWHQSCSRSSGSSRTLHVFSKCRVVMVREIYLKNEIFSRSGKSLGILWMAKEIKKELGKSGNLKINGYGRQFKKSY